MKDAQPRAIRLDEYRPPAFRITDTRLEFELEDETTTVRSTLEVVRASDQDEPLALDGVDLDLESVAVDGRPLTGNEYRIDDEHLVLFGLPERCQVSIVTKIHPEKNTALEGLYKSSRMYCTQCEAQGFRKITYYLDRPDVLSRFTTTIVADPQRYPTLLSNGNRAREEKRPNGRVAVTWEDPFPKPSYLFALVAGDLAVLDDEFTTLSGRRVALRIFSEPHNIGQCAFGMEALKRAMKWDEEAYGREYDLDTFMIVAVEDFNFGAMENKGLNVFNVSAVLATPDTATDAAYQRIEAVIGHEYFHNWSGNRVTCRDWFQLSLKEGFTVFRDAQFSADMNSKTVFRIEDVEELRVRQFPEDAGPLAHPVRPDSYIEISNFYTATIYEKGAEVVRMIHTLLGAERFRRGSDLYFARHDGQAVTTEDFVRAMEDAAGVDLTQFRRWYTQAGTPKVTLRSTFDNGTLQLTFTQSCAPTPGQAEKLPFHIPMALGLLGAGGRDLLGQGNGGVRVESGATIDRADGAGTVIVHLKAPETTVRVGGLAARPVVSALREFSAPVVLDADTTTADLYFLARHDSDGFARWDAMQRLLAAVLEEIRVGKPLMAAPIDLYRELLTEALTARDDGEHKAMLATMLALPAEQYLHQLATEIDVEGIHAARLELARAIGERLFDPLHAVYTANHHEGSYSADGPGIARRSLANGALAFLVAAENTMSAAVAALLTTQLERADNLTDRLAALRGITRATTFDDGRRAALLGEFYERWAKEKLVIDQWFTVQAANPRAGALDRIHALERHPAFDTRNPNRARSVYAAFAANLPHFHAADGSGYRFYAERCVALDATNPQLAARLMKSLTLWQRHTPARRRAMLDALRGAGAAKLSRDTYEVVTKGLEE